MEAIEKRGLTLFPLEGVSRKEWLIKRQDGVGGSDLSSILGLNQYFSALELFYQKIGFSFDASEKTNPAMFWGSHLEDQVLDKAQYLDLDTGEYIDNFLSGTKLRNITKVPYMVSNPNYPHILANLDGAEEFDPNEFLMDAIAEMKTISSKTAEQYESRIPPYHIVQCTTYAMVCEPLFRSGKQARIFYLEDGREFRGFNIPILENMEEQIIVKSQDFWNRVIKGREIMATVKDTAKRLQFLSEIEPEPDHTEAYEAFLSDLWKLKRDFVILKGTYDDLVNAKNYRRLKKQRDEIDTNIQTLRNRLVSTLHKSNANIIDFGKDKDGQKIGRVTYNRKLYVNIKEELK